MPSLSHFRGSAKHPSALHRSEAWLVAILAAHLCFLPWAFGAMRVEAQVVSLALASAGFAISLRPRHYDAETSALGSFRLTMWPKLLRFPIFWIGGLFLAYILIQALNPAWRYVEYDGGWWLVRLPYLAWLPHGMATPIAKASPWRALMIYGSAWLTVCAIWVGLTRKRSLRILLVALAANAFVLALLGLAERGLHADKIFWTWDPPASYFVASFFYKNHAAAYFNLLLSLSAGLAASFHVRARRRQQKSSPSGLFAFFVVILALIVIFSYSRAATILLLAYLAFLLGAFLFHRFRAERGPRQHIGLVALFCVLLGGSALSALYFLPTAEAVDRMNQLVKSYQSATPSDRHLATLATLDLFRDSPAYGWGAGSFRFAFPIYQRYYPSIYSRGSEHFYWEHAHDDYAEFLAEFGLVGTGLLVLGFASFVVILCRRRFWKSALPLTLFTGCLLTLVHCLGDFNFFNPAILLTWCAFWPITARWSEREPARAEPRRAA